MRRELGTFPWQANVLCSLCRVSTGEVCARSWLPGSLPGAVPSALARHRALLLPKNLRAVPFQLSSREPSPEAPQEPAQEAQCRLSWLPERHVAMETCISCYEKQLQQCGEHSWPHHISSLCWVVPLGPCQDQCVLVPHSAIPAGSPSCCSLLVPLPCSQTHRHGCCGIWLLPTGALLRAIPGGWQQGWGISPAIKPPGLGTVLR